MGSVGLAVQQIFLVPRWFPNQWQKPARKILHPIIHIKQRRGRPAMTWFHDLKDWTKLDIAAASQLATDRERWRKIIIKVTAAQIAPADKRERD